MLNTKNRKPQRHIKIFTISLISVFNGALYFAIATDGGANIRAFFKITEHTAHILIPTVSAGASVVYTMFMYKTLEALSLRPNTLPKIALSLLAPFSAAAFLTAGKEGADLLGANTWLALSIGSVLFGLRILNCVDASVKFPARLLETKNAWHQAFQEKDFKEMTRLMVVWVGSLGYVACTTDAVFRAMQIIAGWFGANEHFPYPLGLTLSLLGAVGTLPLNVYWTHRGLRQLTLGGKKNEHGENPDPTDFYTYVGLLFVLPVILGILGGATASTGAVFGRLGIFSEVVRISSSVLYAACAGTPGMATLLRATALRVKQKYWRGESKLTNVETGINAAPTVLQSYSIFPGSKSAASETQPLLSHRQDADLPTEKPRCTLM